MNLVWITVFGALGVLARHFSNELGARALPMTFPWSTFAVNIVGAFAIGLVYVLGVERLAISQALRLGLTVGFLGGFTTFSSYSLETVRLFAEARYGTAILYFVLSPTLGLAATIAGIFLARALRV